MKNEYGEFDNLITAVFLALGEPGAAALKARLTAAMPARPRADRYDSQAAAVQRALQQIADGEKDVDAYIALVPGEDRKCPTMAAEIGRRLLDAGRANEAVAILEAATPKRRPRRDHLEDIRGLGWDGPDGDWESVYIAALDAIGQTEKAQGCAGQHLRSEERAMDHALGFRDLSTALLSNMACGPAGSKLVLERHGEINGNLYYLLDPVARWLEGSHPLAATLLRRA